MDKVANQLEGGQDIQRLILTNNEDQLNKAYMILFKDKQKMKRNKFKKWVCLAVGILIGGILAPLMIEMLTLIGFSFYSRDGLDTDLQDKIGDATFDDITTTELLVTSFDYNSLSPRFFSKKFREYDFARYNVPLKIAVGASSSAPTYFDPLKHIDAYNISSLLIDGGVICNNPAFYAYEIAKELYKESDIRIISLGTGEPPSEKKTSSNPASFNKLTNLGMTNDFLMNIETYTFNHILDATLNNETAKTISTFGFK